MAATALRLSLPTADLAALRDRVRRLAEARPGVYRMIDPLGRVIYVGKAKRVKQRLLSYFRASFPEDKAARILHAAADITSTTSRANSPRTSPSCGRSRATARRSITT